MRFNMAGNVRDWNVNVGFEMTNALSENCRSFDSSTRVTIHSL